MNLAVLAARIAAVEALKGRTFVGENVLDSEIAAIDLDAKGDLRTGQEKRFVAVYTQDSTVIAPSNIVRPFYEGGTCEIVFEMGVTAAMHGRDEETGAATVFEGIPATDSAFEFYLDVLGRQIIDCLSDQENIWADIWRDLCTSVIKIERARTAGGEMVRLAGHQIKMTCAIIDQPIVGEPLDANGGFSKFLVALEAHEDADRQAMAVVLRSTLEGDAPEDWEQMTDRMGLGTGEAQSLGIAPLETDNGAVGTSEDFTIEVDGLGTTLVTGEPE